jgi:energy-coupling factor transport system ATP-binding protein
MFVGHSVLADMAFGLENRGVPPHTISERVRNTARALGIDETLLAADTDQLSGGQLQLVVFAGVLVLQPRLIIVDEPLANLDWDSATRLLQAIRVYAN